MPRPAATSEQRAHIRDRIHRAAVAVYEEKGMEGTSARAIAVEAGVSVGRLYSYYANLPDLMRSLWAEPVEEEMIRLRAKVGTISDPLETLRLLLNGYADFAFRRPDILKGAFLLVRTDQGSALPPAPAADEFERLLGDAVLAGQKTGQIKQGEAGKIAHRLWAGVHGALALPINVESLDFGSPKLLVADMITMLLESIKT